MEKVRNDRIFMRIPKEQKDAWKVLAEENGQDLTKFIENAVGYFISMEGLTEVGTMTKGDAEVTIYIK